MSCGIFPRQNALFKLVGGYMPHRQIRRIDNVSVIETPVVPTAERYRHGAIERLDRPITNSGGTIARPHYAVDTLLAMERRGTITAAMRRAGEDFRRHFVIARLDPLRALDWSRPKQTGALRSYPAETGWRIEKAREIVWQTISAVGGLTPRRLMPMARCRLGALSEGMGARSRLERSPSSARSRHRGS